MSLEEREDPSDSNSKAGSLESVWVSRERLRVSLLLNSRFHLFLRAWTS